MSAESFGRYQLQSAIGRGGMATVYQAYDPRFERVVAVKILPREFMHDPLFRERFEQEAKAIARLEYSSIVPVYDFGNHEGQPYLVMRYMSGGSLEERIQAGNFPLPELVPIMQRVGAALDMAHERGVIHRDVKPANILFDASGDAYLSDFGIAKISEVTAQLTGSGVIGTPLYMAPEMANNDGLSPLVDIYALGVTLFQALTGKVPFEAPTPIGILMAHINAPVPDVRELRSDVPPDVVAVVRKAMAKNPADRYQTGGEFADALEAAMQSGFTGQQTDALTAGRRVRPVSSSAGMETRQPHDSDAVLTIVSAGPLNGQRVDVSGDSFVIGREAGNALTLPDRRASRHHARIDRDEDGSLWLTDLSSSNGTFLNGEEVHDAVELYEGDEIRIGSTSLLVSFDVPRGAVSAAPDMPTITASHQESVRTMQDPIDTEEAYEAHKEDVPLDTQMMDRGAPPPPTSPGTAPDEKTRKRGFPVLLLLGGGLIGFVILAGIVFAAFRMLNPPEAAQVVATDEPEPTDESPEPTSEPAAVVPSTSTPTDVPTVEPTPIPPTATATATPIRVLKIAAFTQYADTRREFSNVQITLNLYAEMEYEIEETSATSEVSLNNVLEDAHVFLIPEQELFNSSGYGIGPSMRPALTAFMERGGRVVSLGQSNGRFIGELQNMGLWDFAYRTNEVGSPIRVVSGFEPLINGLPSSLTYANGTTAYRVTDTAVEVVAESPQGDPIVFYKQIGEGYAIMIGFDWFNSNAGTEMLLCNAVFWPCER